MNDFISNLYYFHSLIICFLNNAPAVEHPLLLIKRVETGDDSTSWHVKTCEHVSES